MSAVDRRACPRCVHPPECSDAKAQFTGFLWFHPVADWPHCGRHRDEPPAVAVVTSPSRSRERGPDRPQGAPVTPVHLQPQAFKTARVGKNPFAKIWYGSICRSAILRNTKKQLSRICDLTYFAGAALHPCAFFQGLLFRRIQNRSGAKVRKPVV